MPIYGYNRTIMNAPTSADPKTFALQRIIELVASETCPAFCPNLARKPTDEGCGLSVCMDQISLLAQQGLTA